MYFSKVKILKIGLIMANWILKIDLHNKFLPNLSPFAEQNKTLNNYNLNRKMDQHHHSESKSTTGEVSSATAVLLGALAPGVNVSTLVSPFFNFNFFVPIFIRFCDLLIFFFRLLFQGATWNTLKSAFLMLGLCLAVMLGLAFSSSDKWLVLHVGFLVLICVTLFFLLSWYFNSYPLTNLSFCNYNCFYFTSCFVCKVFIIPFVFISLCCWLIVE